MINHLLIGTKRLVQSFLIAETSNKIIREKIFKKTKQFCLQFPFKTNTVLRLKKLLERFASFFRHPKMLTQSKCKLDFAPPHRLAEKEK